MSKLTEYSMSHCTKKTHVITAESVSSGLNINCDIIFKNFILVHLSQVLWIQLKDLQHLEVIL